MKLRRDKWENVKIKDCCDILDNLRKPISGIEREKRIENKMQEELYPYYGATGLVGWIDDFLIDDEYVLIGEDGAPFFDKSKDIAYLIRGKSWVNNHVHILKAKPKLADDKYILHYLNSFNDFGGYVNGTTRLKLNKGQLERIPIHLPPLEEQKQIAALFQSIETAMEQVDGQEKNLLQLKNKLLRDLFSEKKEFGYHLTDKDFETVRFDKIAINISERVEPKKTELTTYVGLEHLDADNLKIERTGTPDDVIGTKLKIYKGDIIFGKRRAYLRKVAVSHFDGIASAHSMILRANEKNIEKEFLPFFMQSDAFMSRAVQISEGSLSPTIKNKTLAVQEFILPKKEKQKELILLFKQFDTVIEQLKAQKTTLKNLKQKLLNEILG
ncbi:MAG: restriction endonuclease subunit S [Chitinophagaceae bacterium]|nr:restriction endonuclease subunit S [Chitinophagaceae bacterium]